MNSHLHAVGKLAAGIPSLPSASSAFAATQAAWRFNNNPRVTFAALVEPLRAEGRKSLNTGQAKFALLVHDWCKLSLQRADQHDVVQLTHDTDIGYELTTALLVSADDGQPLAPLEMPLKTADGTLSTRDETCPTLPHLEQVLPTMEASRRWELPRPLLHVIDREADSVDHYRQWDAAGHKFLIRGDNRRVRWQGSGGTLQEIREKLRRKQEFQAAGERRLQSREDYHREVTRLLADPSYYRGPVNPSLSGMHIHSHGKSHPKLVRFLREFFAYPGAIKVFKDSVRSGGYYQNPDRGHTGSPGWMIHEADELVIWCLEQDRHVFEQLLTIDRFFVYHNMDTKTGQACIAAWKQVYETLKDTAWKTEPERVMEEHFRMLVAAKVVDGRLKEKEMWKEKRAFLSYMYYFQDTFGQGRTPYTRGPFTHGYSYNHSPSYNLPTLPSRSRYEGVETPRYKEPQEFPVYWDYLVEQPFVIEHRKGMLTHPAWLIAHSSNFHTDPIRRGRWIREKLLAGITVDELGHHYTGIPGIENEKVNMHDIGHGKTIGCIPADEIRARTELYHMQLVDTIVTRLKNTPEGNGTMFDNTMLFYFPDSGETHHSQGTEYPFVVLSGRNSRLDIARRYIRLPAYGQAGHKTLGNWYTTLLNTHGHSIEHYGDLDVVLEKFKVDQRGPIRQFLA